MNINIKYYYNINFIAAYLFFILIFSCGLYAENRFFYSEYENLLKRMEKNDSSELYFYMDAVRQQKIEQDWSYPELPDDYFTHQIPELNYAPLEQGLLRSAYSHYENAILVMNEMKRELAGMDEKIKSIKSNVWWKEIDEADSLYRIRHAMKMKYAVRLSQTAGNAIDILESIQNSSVRSKRAYINLYFQSLRMFIIYEIMLGNYDIAYPSLLKYKFNPESEYEWPYHYLLSRCYRHKYLVSKNNTGTGEEELNLLRKMKNMHHLIFISLKYGYGSEEYRVSKEKVYRDELGSPRSLSNID